MDKIIKTVFFKSESGSMPVRDWLYELSQEERKRIGEEIKTVEFGWPLGMPVVKKLAPNLWEVRIRLKDKIARVIFTIVEDYMVLLHGFIKKSQKIPQEDIELALKRLRLVQEVR
ncbi:MAG: type II toxin-antitoxin system RelE/ParE family toxin [Spirochaetota bacterium]